MLLNYRYAVAKYMQTEIQMSLGTIFASLVREWFKCGIGMDCPAIAVHSFGHKKSVLKKKCENGNLQFLVF